MDRYHSSARSKKRNEKENGQSIESDDSDGDADDNKNPHPPGDKLGSCSESESDTEDKV